VTDIVLHIDRLVLDGIPLAPGDSRVLHAAVERELSRLLATGALAPALLDAGAVPRVTAPSIALPSTASAAVLGQRIAAAVHGGIRG
jgi:hypothetical protein